MALVNGDFMVGNGVGPFLNGTDNWAYAAFDQDLPTNDVYGVAINPAKTLVACAQTVSPYIKIFQVSDWSALANPSTLPTGTARSVAFSPDGSLLAVAHSTSPYLTIYNTSDWSKVANPSSLPPDDGEGIAFSPDGTKLAVSHETSPYLTIYNTSDWSKITDPGTLPAGIPQENSIGFSPDGTWLAIGHATSPYVTIYVVSTWAKVANPGTLPSTTVEALDWSPDSSRLAVGSGGTTDLQVYDTSDWSTVSSLPTAEGTVSAVRFLNDALLLVGYDSAEPLLEEADISGTPAWTGRRWRWSTQVRCIATVAYTAVTYSGTVKDESGTLAARKVRCYHRATGLFVGETTSDGGTGAFSVVSPFDDEHYFVCLDADTPDDNALVLDLVDED